MQNRHVPSGFFARTTWLFSALCDGRIRFNSSIFSTWRRTSSLFKSDMNRAGALFRGTFHAASLTFNTIGSKTAGFLFSVA